MAEDKQYWKELLGDDFDEKIYEEIIAPSMDIGEPACDGKNEVKDDGNGDHTGDAAERSGGGKNTEESGRNWAYDIPVGDEDDIKTYEVSSATEEKKWNSIDNSQTEYGSVPDDFEVNIPDDIVDTDEYYDDYDEGYDDYDERAIRRNRRRRTGCLGGIMYAAFVIGVSLLAASLGWLAATDVLAFGKDDEDVTITVPEECTVEELSEILYDAGLINYKFLFTFYGNFASISEKVSAGTYELNTKYDYNALVNGMSSSGTERSTVDVTIPEGYTMAQIFELLEANEVCTAEELYEAAANYEFEYDFLDDEDLGDAQRLEGYLFPDTYTFYVGDSASNAIKKFLSNFNKKFTDEMITRAEELGYTVDEIITIASMIEEEAANDDERADIASIIYNRLNSDSFPYLQLDSTVIYALGDEYQGGTLTYDDLEVDSEYNTYKNTGLPAGPISNPGLASITAALYPNETNYYYYALNVSGVHSFFNSASEFNAFLESDEYAG